MRIGILSDTHGLLRPQVRAALAGCEILLHAGDVGKRKVLEDLEEIAPVLAVRGNADEGTECSTLPSLIDTSLGGLRVVMTHRRKDLPFDLGVYGLAVVGHTHRYEKEEQDGCLLLNPGSCGPRRFFQEVSLALVTVQEGKLSVEKLLPCDLTESVPSYPEAGQMRETVEKIVREVKRHRSVEEISRRQGLDPLLVEQVTRLLLTHPGVDTDGILRKMGL